VLACRNQRLQNRPLCIGQVTRIGFADRRFHVQAPWFGETKDCTLRNLDKLEQDHFSDSL
jgi:hypothetical protein